VTVGGGVISVGDGKLQVTERDWAAISAWIDDWKDCAKKRGIVIEEANR
jgi:hypothetical protein